MDYMHARSMEHYQKLTEAERMVIDYILSTEKIESLRLQQIREALFVSNATVVRACKKMNFATFNELKYAVIHHKNERVQLADPSDFFSRIENIKTVTLKTLDSLEEKKIKQFCSCLINARRIFCVGIDSCLSIAKEFNQRLKLVDLWTNVYSDNTLISKIPKVSTSRDVVVVFVLSRQLPTLSHEIFDANQRGVRVVRLTNVTQNPIYLTELTKIEQLETPSLSWQTCPELMIAIVSNIVCDTLKVTLHQEN